MVDDRPTGLERLALRAPLLAYRAGLGQLFGTRLVHVTHKGRTSGKPRHVVLEVVRYDRERPEIVVVTGWGPRSDWYRDLRVNPAIEVRFGKERWAEPSHRHLDAAETDSVLRAYRDEHPRLWPEVAPHLGLPDDPANPEWARTIDHIGAVAFSPR
ncbi:nitroreductase family deazaflavin-dependent oxidoreductase [Actinokineospora auranticolor]|uniref:Deazaflavin-dependent oxidoreductase (Nitroreductase family) n=1 Tax=Actinokineospora auranticolor TaxID=155976 RepID=A0A2S6GT09_9PSEU|nr:nitroreductase family deazaflavin-dependent oxidoreductase [Actinokineospora auranticolor]PPK68340.1 deazaflavin-dependent oxidoreductase (nitroreductase family) [Actinokineospora auranticolor]